MLKSSVLKWNTKMYETKLFYEKVEPISKSTEKYEYEIYFFNLSEKTF